ncbi:hypothetical protein HRI_003441900 [Hibiscus trionum]|uniref:Transcription repressor n=1 Tax=Hibiscus trionum TaxID=183268 RepID=A0A9W7ILE1_HIBTR|nr:hypothetical protein HRI_003441900 [Hibiscus trionum]
MENRFKLRISRIFRSSFSSCRTRNVSDVVEKAVFSAENHNKFQSIKLSSPSPPSPKDRSLPSVCKPRCPYQPTQEAVNLDSIMAAPPPRELETLPRRRKVSAKAPPASPMNLFSDCKDFAFYEKKKSSATNKKKNSKRVHAKRNNTSFDSMFFSSSSHQSINFGGRGRGRGWWWFSSEDETETLFSSRTLSSSDSSSELVRHQPRDHRRKRNARRRRAKSGNKVKDSFAVVKSSDDPYTDFRASMVEMIVEREMFEAKELEQLLQCFLSLNSHHHHRIIVEVFTEICNTLFSNWS